jgi:hypothetical protein
MRRLLIESGLSPFKPPMKVTVKKEGALIPKRLLGSAKPVEILEDKGRLVVVPLPAPDDPIFKLGKRPVKTGVADAADKHDAYLYDGS